MGDLTQNGNEGQSQTFGNLSQNASESQGQTMGNQTQNPSQGQSGSILSQTQNPSQTGSTVTQNQNPVQTQSGSATQTQSPSQTGSNQTQTTGPQTLQANPTNSSSADVTQNVSGVTVNVPVNVTVDCGCGKGFKCEKQQQQACCDCCARALGNLLRQVQQYQSTNLETINIYLINSPALAENPVLDQTITNVNDCATVSFATGPVVTTPSTTAQLCKVAGFSASTPGLITFLTNYANACTNNNPCTCNGDCGCGCGCGQCNCGNVFCSCNTCANGIGEQLNLHTGSLLNLVIEGVPTPIDGVRLLKVCDCLAFFMNDATSTFYVFTLCSIVAFTPAAPGPV
ncbi:hypothetical protein JOD45_003002 [Scopulibacillus daqui]|uniref:Spore coat protein Z n=1 Tax=Scopulibacillus daqui TaxID=1469162 RepID=A0ABS2Q390_9BACL|nr:hypothetical protein [Scopulibacillus daqui]MBM7646768.1 hypothetical protein [Scopulibacillus daqui]